MRANANGVLASWCAYSGDRNGFALHAPPGCRHMRECAAAAGRSAGRANANVHAGRCGERQKRKRARRGAQCGATAARARAGGQLRLSAGLWCGPAGAAGCGGRSGTNGSWQCGAVRIENWVAEAGVKRRQGGGRSAEGEAGGNESWGQGACGTPSTQRTAAATAVPACRRAGKQRRRLLTLAAAAADAWCRSARRLIICCACLRRQTARRLPAQRSPPLPSQAEHTLQVKAELIRRAFSQRRRARRPPVPERWTPGSWGWRPP